MAGQILRVRRVIRLDAFGLWSAGLDRDACSPLTFGPQLPLVPGLSETAFRPRGVERLDQRAIGRSTSEGLGCSAASASSAKSCAAASVTRSSKLYPRESSRKLLTAPAANSWPGGRPSDGGRTGIAIMSAEIRDVS